MPLSPSTFRHAAIGISTAAVLMLPQAANALTMQACEQFAAGFKAYVKAQPKGTFTAPFIQSVRNYVIPDGKVQDCSGRDESGRATINVMSLDDFTGWVNVENMAKAAGVLVAPEVRVVLIPGADPRISDLLAKRERQLSEQAALATPRLAP
jgi:hypothetical protein